ncbi:hypothetical protein E2C01_050846 [Portunus trituberculatus]|uniref:Uncharacterized protein n=1 Tax=Portunus trituberculatus TaxID=210409 RepID=A0A5B7G9D8_PORTR|nr:hypothetical protein [Portunus trituberculatus]
MAEDFFRVSLIERLFCSSFLSRVTVFHLRFSSNLPDDCLSSGAHTYIHTYAHTHMYAFPCAHHRNHVRLQFTAHLYALPRHTP